MCIYHKRTLLLSHQPVKKPSCNIQKIKNYGIWQLYFSAGLNYSIFFKPANHYIIQRVLWWWTSLRNPALAIFCLIYIWRLNQSFNLLDSTSYVLKLWWVERKMFDYGIRGWKLLSQCRTYLQLMFRNLSYDRFHILSAWPIYVCFISLLDLFIQLAHVNMAP